MRTLLTALVALILLAQTGQAREFTALKRFSPFADVIAFGDSLTDIGNVAEITELDTAPRIEGYHEESRYSDGAIWVEHLARFWGLPPRTPGRGQIRSLPEEPGGNTWAWGNAEAASGAAMVADVAERVPNLLTQIHQYLRSNTPDPHTLFVVWSGADNLLVGGRFGPQAAREAARAVITSMQRLERAGARHILVVDLPNLGDTPRARSGGIIDQTTSSLYSRVFNRILKRQVARLRGDRQFDAWIYLAHAFSELVLIVHTVGAGRTYRPRFFVPGPPVMIRNLSGEALEAFDRTGTFPDDYLFWDDAHPTTQGHQIVVGKMLQAIRRGWISWRRGPR